MTHWQDMLRIYIACPYSIGDKDRNVLAAIEAAELIMKAGHRPVNPLLLHYHNSIFQHGYDDWLEQDFSDIVTCKLLVRLPGESRGADREVAFAKEYGLEVFYGMEILLEYLQGVHADRMLMGEREADEDIKHGRVSKAYSGADELIAALNREMIYDHSQKTTEVRSIS